MNALRIDRVRVDADRAPDPALLRAAIEARLAGRRWAGPERAVAEAVARALERGPRSGGSKDGSGRECL